MHKPRSRFIKEPSIIGPVFTLLQPLISKGSNKDILEVTLDQVNFREAVVQDRFYGGHISGDIT